MPRYLRERRKEKKMIKVARFRFGNKMRERRYWERDEKKVGYMGGRKKHENTHTHIVEVC